MRYAKHSLLALAATVAVSMSVSATIDAQGPAASAPGSKMPAASAAGMSMGMGMDKGKGMDMSKGMAAGDAHGSDQMHKSMMSGMEGMKMMKPTGDTDKDFAVMMKMHHQQALEMAKAEIAHGKSTELDALSRKIIAAQQKEIAQLDKWLATNK